MEEKAMDMMATMSLLILEAWFFIWCVVLGLIVSATSYDSLSELEMSKLWPIAFIWPTRSVILISGLFPPLPLLFFVCQMIY